MVLAHTWSPPLRLPSSHRSLPLSLRPGHSPAPSPLSSTCVFRNAACLSSLSASPHQRHPFWKLTPLCAPPAPPPAPPPALTAPLQLAQASAGLGTKQGTTKRSESRAVNSRQCVLLVLEFSEGGPVFHTCPHPQKSHSPTAPRELSFGAGGRGVRRGLSEASRVCPPVPLPLTAHGGFRVDHLFSLKGNHVNAVRNGHTGMPRRGGSLARGDRGCHSCVQSVCRPPAARQALGPSRAGGFARPGRAASRPRGRGQSLRFNPLIRV